MSGLWSLNYVYFRYEYNGKGLRPGSKKRFRFLFVTTYQEWPGTFIGDPKEDAREYIGRPGIIFFSPSAKEVLDSVIIGSLTKHS